MVAVAVDIPRPKRRADRREVECRLRAMYDWLMRLTDQGGLYTGIDMWSDAGHGDAGHLVLIRELPQKVMVTMTAVGMVQKIYRDALDLKYAYLRTEQGREVTDFDRSMVAGVSETLFTVRVSRGRRYTQKNLLKLEKL